MAVELKQPDSDRERRTAKLPIRLGGETLEALVLLIPGLVLLLVFLVWPTLNAFWLSFHRENLLGTQRD